MIAETDSINIHVFVLIYYTYLLIKDRKVNILFFIFYQNATSNIFNKW